MKEKLEVHVGDDLEDTGRRFIAAWRSLENGKRVRERHLSFESLEGLLSLLTPKRWELLKYVHSHPVQSVRALSLQLKRDYPESMTMSKLWRWRGCWNGMDESCERIMTASTPVSDLINRSSDQRIHIFQSPLFRLQGWLGDSLRYCRNSATL